MMMSGRRPSFALDSPWHSTSVVLRTFTSQKWMAMQPYQGSENNDTTESIEANKQPQANQQTNESEGTVKASKKLTRSLKK